jgi:hypothetical protein
MRKRAALLGVAFLPACYDHSTQIGAAIGSGVVALAIGAYLLLAPTHETWLVAPPNATP